jgi:ATP-dependent exoDNAse (exonuclease V) beta subunit
MTTQEYRKYPALNYSLAKHLLDSPAHYKAAQDEECEPSEAMMLGTITHTLVLEGRNTLDEYAIKPEGMSFATKEGKAWKAEQTKEIVSEKKALKIPCAAEAIARNPYAGELLRLCPNRETPIVVEYRGVKIKVLIDACGSNIISDFKTAQDASERGFTKAVFDRHYDLQAAMYQTALAIANKLDEPPKWYWLACELSAPFYNQVFVQGKEVYANGMAKLDFVIDEYKRCTAISDWSLPVAYPQTITLPNWSVFTREETE